MTTTTTTSSSNEVQRGIEFLDAIDPSLLDDLDLETLDLGSGEDCVLGQIAHQIIAVQQQHPDAGMHLDYSIFVGMSPERAYNDSRFRIVCDADYSPLFGLELEQCIGYGFVLPADRDRCWYDPLTDEWLSQLEARQA